MFIFCLHDHQPKTGNDYSVPLQRILLCQDAASVSETGRAVFTQIEGRKKSCFFKQNFLYILQIMSKNLAFHQIII